MLLKVTYKLDLFHDFLLSTKLTICFVGSHFSVLKYEQRNIESRKRLSGCDAFTNS
jgi:hypothetical protein